MDKPATATALATTVAVLRTDIQSPLHSRWEQRTQTTFKISGESRWDFATFAGLKIKN
jgi:hypothetical protein